MSEAAKKLKSIQDRILKHQKENGFETIFDFINEDLIELESQMAKKTPSADVNKIDTIVTELMEDTFEDDVFIKLAEVREILNKH